MEGCGLNDGICGLIAGTCWNCGPGLVFDGDNVGKGGGRGGGCKLTVVLFDPLSSGFICFELVLTSFLPFSLSGLLYCFFWQIRVFISRSWCSYIMCGPSFSFCLRPDCIIHTERCCLLFSISYDCNQLSGF